MFICSSIHTVSSICQLSFPCVNVCVILDISHLTFHLEISIFVRLLLSASPVYSHFLSFVILFFFFHFNKLSEDLVSEQVQKIVRGLSLELEHSFENRKGDKNKHLCPCCFDAFRGNYIEELCKKIHSDLVCKCIDLKRSVFLRVIIPPMLDTARITVRTIVTKSNEKTFVFPTMSELTNRLIVENLKVQGLNIVNDITVADFQVKKLNSIPLGLMIFILTASLIFLFLFIFYFFLLFQYFLFFLQFKVAITGFIPNQTKYLLALCPEYKHKKKKRKFGEAACEESFEVTRADADSVLVYYKSFTPKDFYKLESSLVGYMNDIEKTEIVEIDSNVGLKTIVSTDPTQSILPSSSLLTSSMSCPSSSSLPPSTTDSPLSTSGLSWVLEISPSPLYLLGRLK